MLRADFIRRVKEKTLRAKVYTLLMGSRRLERAFIYTAIAFTLEEAEIKAKQFGVDSGGVEPEDASSFSIEKHQERDFQEFLDEALVADMKFEQVQEDISKDGKKNALIIDLIESKNIEGLDSAIAKGLLTTNEIKLIEDRIKTNGHNPAIN